MICNLKAVIAPSAAAARAHIKHLIKGQHVSAWDYKVVGKIQWSHHATQVLVKICSRNFQALKNNISPLQLILYK